MVAAGLFAIAAVLAGDRVVVVETTAPAVVRELALPAPAAALFAAPDGRLVLPLADSDETVVLSLSGPAERWPGRVFPVFFDEIDRMHVVFPGELIVMSYPERLPILRVPAPGLPVPWRAACSRNGLLVAVCPPPRERRLVLMVAEPGAMRREVGLAGEPRHLAMAPDGAWAAVGFDDGVEVVVSGEPRGRGRIAVTGGVRALAVAPGGRDLLVGAGDAATGSLLSLRVSGKLPAGAKKSRELPLAAGVTGLAAGPDAAVALAGDRLLVLGRKGRTVARELQLAGARQVVLLPGRPETGQPLWSQP